MAKVKQLEWSDGGRGYLVNRTSVSTTMFGRYLVEQYGDWCVYFDGQLQSKGHPNEDAAKAAAQADYERRILSALEPDPRIALAVEALETTRRFFIGMMTDGEPQALFVPVEVDANDFTEAFSEACDAVRATLSALEEGNG